MTYAYDPQASYLITALRFSHTVVPSVLRRPTFWLFFVLHLGVQAAYRLGYLKGAHIDNALLSISWNIIHVISGMTTFFEVFYTNLCFTRYMSLYHQTRGILGHLSTFIFDMRIHAGDKEQKMVRLASRFFLGSVFLFFFEMNGSVSEEEWNALVEYGLIREDERPLLDAYDRQQRSLVLMHWSGRVARETITSAKAPTNVLKGLIDRLLEVRQLELNINDTMNLPMPFQYFHLLNLMVVLNLALWAYAMGVTDSIFAPFGFFFAELIFCGMMELASQLSDPYGDDEVDFPLKTWLEHALWDCMVLLEYEYTIGKDGWTAITHGEPAFDTSFRKLQLDQLEDSKRMSIVADSSAYQALLAAPADGAGVELESGKLEASAPVNSFARKGYGRSSSQKDAEACDDDDDD